jgi:hypothetical protein
MQIIESRLFTTLIPDKGYKIVNKKTGSFHKKVILGVNDSPDNYGEVVDEKYINMDYVVELDNLKTSNTETLNTLLLAIDEIYVAVEPLLMMIPMPISEEDKVTSNLIPFYAEMVKRGLKTKEEVPERFREEVIELLEK